MHRQVQELLGKAKGESKAVLVLNVDVREFSKFSLEVDSVETALYVRKLYKAVLEDFFPSPSYFKLTGDGLLMVFDVEEGDTEALTECANAVVEQSLELTDRFPTLLEKDDWVYFPMPKRIGMGLARGTACRLVADDLTLDYSGTVLNIASRLMDIARPEGVVLDQTFPFNLLRKSLQEPFRLDEKVYLRSVAEEFPRSVYYDPERTEISPANRRPLDKVDWKEIKETKSFSAFRDMGPNFAYPLEGEPLDPQQIWVEVLFPERAPTKKRPNPNQWSIKPVDAWEIRSEGGRHSVRLDIDAIAKRVSRHGAKSTWPVTLVIRYPT